MTTEKCVFEPKREADLISALVRGGAEGRVSDAMDRIALRVKEYREAGFDPSKSALARLSLEFKLTEWSYKIRCALEEIEGDAELRLAEAVGNRFLDCEGLDAQRQAGQVQLDAACSATDRFADILLYACDWTVEEVGLGKDPHDQAVRQLAMDVAADWKWATHTELPKVRTGSTLRHPRSSASHPLWIALDAAGFDLNWGAVRVLRNYVLGKNPSAGGVGTWTMDGVSSEFSAHIRSLRHR